MIMKMILLRISLFVALLTWAAAQETGDTTRLDCPNECTCEVAPMRGASFVIKWMTSWGEEDLPNVRPNDVLDAGMMAGSSTASDAEVDVELIGHHATCSIHPTTNVTRFLFSLPQNLMVLSILQAPGCNFTIIDGGELENLKSLKALHLQGYAHECKKQVSGFTPNRVPEVVKHNELMEKEPNEKKQSIKLQLALAEDSLEPLMQLQLLDIQYVRLVASKDVRRSRRYSSKPVDSKTLLDMPLSQFLRLAGRVDNFRPPPYLDSLFTQNRMQPKNENDMNNNIPQMKSLYSKLQEELSKGGVIRYDKGQDITEKENSIYGRQENSLDLQEIMPYDKYLTEIQAKLAPFKTLADLKYLRVAHARLDRIGPELLDGLQKLHTLTLEYNNVQLLPDRVFSPTPNLRHLSLAHNNLFALDSESFDGLSQLLTLDLDYNNLSVLGPTSIPHLPNLQTMRVFGNPISHLLPDAFESLKSTKSLFLGSSNLSMDIHLDTFRFLSSLETLVLENITMNTLERTLLGGMEILKRLTVHGHIPIIDYDAFSTISRLIKLDLSHCQLSRLSMDAFFGLSNLRLLDLSHNELTSFSPGTFDHLIDLRLLYLHHNKLETLPLGIFLPIPAKLIQLNHNPWHCSCDLLQLRPSITNKITKRPRISCTWDDKLETICTKIKGRLVYDARVAPLCRDPPELRGHDVYHAALRHLKCSKYHWDPRLLQRNTKTLLSHEAAANQLNLNKEKIRKMDITQESSEEDSGRLPLMAFTPKKDLLEIAERENLEEVGESALSVPSKNKIQKNAHQNDAPAKILNKDLQRPKVFKMRYKPILKNVAKSTYLGSKLEEKRKLKIKAFLKKKQRHEEKKKIMRGMEEKIRIKALIKGKQRRLQQKRVLKMKMKRVS